MFSRSFRASEQRRERNNFIEQRKRFYHTAVTRLERALPKSRIAVFQWVGEAVGQQNQAAKFSLRSESRHGDNDRNLLYIIMAAAVQGRVDWLRETERDRQGVSLLAFTLLVFCTSTLVPMKRSKQFMSIQVFSEFFGFLCQFSFHRTLHTHHRLSSGAGTTGQLVADVPSGLSLTPPHEIKKKIMTRQVPGPNAITSNLTASHNRRSRDIAVGIATGYGLDDRGVEFESQ
jgi:hypothetical protein